MWIGLVGLAALGAACAVGTGADAATNLAAVLTAWGRSGWIVVVLALAALGLGRGAAWCVRGAKAWDGQARAALGLALLMVAAITLGWAGLVGSVWAWAWVGPWVLVGAIDLARGAVAAWAQRFAQGARGVGWWAWAALVPGSAVLAVAACSSPGWLFDSEFGGYDALSYHLQLPQEWHRLGRVVPLEHNVYSYLPSGVEALFALIAGLTGAPIDGPTGHGLSAGTGWRIIACQQLHAAMAVFAAWQCGVLARDVACGVGGGESPSEDRHRWVAPVVAGAVLATPWVVVTGALAYNEMAMLALGAAACRAALCRPEFRSVVRRGVVCGVLMAGSCAAKPTALLFIAPLVAIIMLCGGAFNPGVAGGARRRAVSLAACGVAGAVFVAPWLTRNWAYGGNPVFPQLAGVFGTAHWTPEQAERFARAHHGAGVLGAGGGLGGTGVRAARRLVWTDPEASPGSALTERFRGLAHPQWGLIVPAAVVTGAVTLARRRTRGVPALAAVLLAGLLAQALAWALATHMQSRFLIPMLVPAAGLVGLGVRSLGGRAGAVLAAGLVAVQGVFLAVNWAGQRAGEPTARLLIGPELETGRLPPGPDGVGPADLVPSAFINALVKDNAGARPALVGMATPAFIEAPVVWSTTWDTWAIGAAAAANPEDTAEWVRAYRQLGVTHVVIAWGEVERLSRSGYADPLLTPQNVRRLAEACGDPVRVFDGAGVSVHKIPAEGRDQGNDGR